MKIGDTAPDFEAETTQGRIRFHGVLVVEQELCERPCQFRFPNARRAKENE